MEKLPLEMKQRICSFLHDSPKLLIPIRLVSKQWAYAAEPYLIPRIFLFNHPDSCDEVQEILQHPVFSKYVTTLAVDVSKLKYHRNFEDWIYTIEGLQFPEWSEFRPIGIAYHEDGEPALNSPESQATWDEAEWDFNQALDFTIQLLEEDYEGYWERQKYLAEHVQLDPTFKARFWRVVTEAFETCPSLANLIIAPPNRHSRSSMSKRNRIFEECIAAEQSFVVPSSHLPLEPPQREILQATKNSRVGLNSLTIVDLPISFTDFSMTTGLRSVESLKHIRIGYNRLHCNPKTVFSFNLETVLHAAQLLQTLWVEMPPLMSNEYNAVDLLRAINSKHFRDILLHNVVVSEDSMVDFLHRHTDTLQQLDLGVTLSPGTWRSTFQKVSKEMKVLRRIQLVAIREIQASKEVMFSPKWCLEAKNFLVKGGELSEPAPYGLDTMFEDEIETPLRNGDLPEKGLWSDYDGESNVCF
jgi:hypothetical protein